MKQKEKNSLMTLEEVKDILQAEVITGLDDLQKEIKMACGSDLMSDVLSFIKSSSLLLTGLTNQQVVRTAEMADIAAICFVRGKKPDKETIKLAQAQRLPLLATQLPMFESCARLHENGLIGCSESKEQR